MADIFGFNGKTAYVLGLGKSGLATAVVLRDAGVHVQVWDDNPDSRNQAAEAGYFVQNPERVNWPSIGAVVKSPGIAMTHPVPAAARKMGVDVLGDVDLFWLQRQASGATFLGITGTNGKSTTTALVGHILKHAGLNVAVGGNIGVPLLALPQAGVYVLELSSYQLETMRHAQFDGAIFLNLTPDHLERHGSMGVYLATKLKLLKAVKKDGVKVLGVDSEPTRAYAAEHPAGLTTISVAAQTDSGFANLPGPHNAQNIACALALCQPFLPPGFDMTKAITSFAGLPHRMEKVATKNGVVFINDSKATNGDSTVPALQSFTDIYWICGGQAKSDGLGAAVEALANVRQAFTIGSAAASFAANLEFRHIPTVVCHTLENAVEQAYQAARLGGHAQPVVLLSPAAASLDQFKNFEHRGEVFIRAVSMLR